MNPGRNVFIFGDSICFGQGVSPHRTWATRISASLEAKFGNRFVLVNSSVNGNTSRMALERMPFDVQAHGLVFLLLQFGMNDANHWKTDSGVPRVSPDAFRSNMLEIIDRARTFGARKVLLQTNHPSTKDEIMAGGGKTYAECNAHYNAIIRSIAKQRDFVTLNDIERYFERHAQPLERFLLKDGIHLNVNGHGLYYEAVWPVFSRLVEEVVEAR